MVVSEGRAGNRQLHPRRSLAALVIGPGRLLGALATAGVIVSLFLAWRDPGVHPSGVPAAFLWDRTATGGPSLLIFMIPLAVILAIGSLVPFGGRARLLGAIGVLIVTGVFAYQLDRTVDAFGSDLGDALGTGFYLAAIGGLVALASAFARRSAA